VQVFRRGIPQEKVQNNAGRCFCKYASMQDYLAPTVKQVCHACWDVHSTSQSAIPTTVFQNKSKRGTDNNATLKVAVELHHSWRGAGVWL